MELAGNTYWFVLVFGVILICAMFLILRAVFAAFARHMNVTASASGTPAPEMTTATGNAMLVGLALGFFLAWLMLSFVAYFGIDLLIHQKGAATPVVQGPPQGGNPNPPAPNPNPPAPNPNPTPGLLPSPEPAPTGAEYEKATGKVKVLSARPAGYRLQAEFTRPDGTVQPLDLGEREDGAILPNCTFVQVRWFKGNEVTGFTPATIK